MNMMNSMVSTLKVLFSVNRSVGSSGHLIFRILTHNVFSRIKPTVPCAYIGTSALTLNNESGEMSGKSTKGKTKRPKIDALTSIQYLNSKAYGESYGAEPVWTHYRRNFKGHFMPDTRKTCIRSDYVSTGSPCPICRDEHLVVDYRNVKLLEQFISPYTGEVLPTKKTGVCQKQQKRLLTEIAKARDIGFIEADVPFRYYDYSEYYDLAKKSLEKKHPLVPSEN